MFGLQLIFLLALIGGGIAYIGDRIGMRVGRKRLTVFGLRPRHSSIVVTVLTGVMIAALSLGVLTVASDDVRTALFEMKEIQAALAETSDALAANEQELAIVRELLLRQREAVDEMVEQRDAAVLERDAAKEERDRLMDEMEKVWATLNQAQEDVELWKARVANFEELGQTLEDNIAKMQQTEEKLRRDIALLSEQYLMMEGRLRSGAFTYLRDEIVAARVMDSTNPQAVEEELLAFLEEADAIALARGARIQEKETAIELGSEEFFFQAVDLMQSEPGQWVVRAVAMQNTVEGEPLRVYLHLFPRRMVYADGEVIGYRELEGGQGGQEGHILSLLDEVNRDALEKGMITSQEGDVGRLTGEAFVDALVELRRINGRAQVAAVADGDVWNTEGPLEIRLEVNPI